MLKFFALVLILVAFAASSYSQNVGVGTTTPHAAFNVATGKTVLFGNDTTGGGGKLMWIPSKYAFRAGGIGAISTQGYIFNEDPHAWDPDSIGAFSFAGGYQNKAFGIGSTAFGSKNIARGWLSVALGDHNELSKEYGFAMGVNNRVKSNSSTAIGFNNEVNSAAGFAIGSNNEAYGDFNIGAIGWNNTCTNYSAMALGTSNTSTNNYSTAIGANHLVESVYGMSIGFNSINNSACCTIVGSGNVSDPSWSSSTWKGQDPIFIVGNGHTSDTRANAMVILKNGKVGIGTNDPDGLVHAKFDSSPGVPQLLLEESASDYARITFRNTNPGFWDIATYSQPLLSNIDNAKMNFFFGPFGNVLVLKGNGNATLSGTLTQNSDQRLKENIEPLSNALARVMKVNGYTYNWKDTLRGSDLQIGFIAQELEQEFPELVAADEDGIKSVAYSNMIPVLLEAIKEQQKEIEELKTIMKAK